MLSDSGPSSVLFPSRSAGTDQRCSRSWLSRLQDTCKYVPTCFSTEVDAFVLTKRFGFGRADTTLAGGGDVNGRLHTHTHSHSLTLTHIHSLTYLTYLTYRTHSPTHSLHFTSLHSLHSLSHPSLTHTTLTSLTHTLTHSLYMNIHTYTQTHPPSPLHHSYTSSSLLALLWSV